MQQSIKEKLELSIENLEQKKVKLYFLVQDTKNNAKASVRFIYQIAKTLYDNGFNSIILHEKKEYGGVDWIGEDYSMIPHNAIEGENLQIAPEDFIIIPEIYGYVMEQIKHLPCAKVVITQQYAHMLETLNPGQSWSQFGFLKCITTNHKQKEYIERVMRQVSIDVIEPYISDKFYPKSLPPMPIIGIHTKEQSDALNIIKTFYLKFPQYRWFTFRDLRGLSEKEFANSIRDCFLTVWIDDKSGFGTFPLESMKSNVPCIGKVPDLVPDWLNEENGIWITDQTLFPDVIADYIQNWLEDNIKPELYESIQKTAENFSDKKIFEQTTIELFERYLATRLNSFKEQLSKTEN